MLAVEVRVAGPQVGEQGQAGQGGVGLPVIALAEADVAGRAMRRVIVVALEDGAILVLGGPAVPAAVGVLVASEPVQGPFDRLLALARRPGALGQGESIRVEPRPIDGRDVGRRPGQAGRPADRRQVGHPRGGDTRQGRGGGQVGTSVIHRE